MVSVHMVCEARRIKIKKCGVFMSQNKIALVLSKCTSLVFHILCILICMYGILF
jgi:hypothetical protein